MESVETIKVLLIKHPFKSDKESIYLEKNTFRKIYEELELDFPIENYVILDGDQIVKDYSQMPSSEYIYIKCIPQGDGGAFASEGRGLKGAGGILAAVGIGAAILALTVLTGGIATTVLAIGVSAALSGAVTFGFGAYLYNYELQTDAYSGFGDAQASPSIKGGKNTYNNNGRIPVLLGRHLIVPFYAIKPYAKNEYGINVNPLLSSKDQYFYGAFCSGYAPMSIDTNTYKIGDTPISSYKGVTTAIEESTGGDAEYNIRIVSEYVGAKCERGSIGDDAPDPDNYLVRTTAINTTTIVATALFPTGALQYEDDGTHSAWTTAFIFEYKPVGSPDSSYIQFGDNYTPVGYPSHCQIVRSEEQTFRYNAVVTPTPVGNRQYNVRMRRKGRDDSTNKEKFGINTSTALYWEDLKSYVRSDNNEYWAIDPAIKGDLNIVNLRVLATDQLNGQIDTFNYEATAYSRYYNGTGSGPSQWVTGLSSNPASAFLMVLTNPLINADALDSVKEITRIDWESLEDWYTFCSDKDFECNAYVVGEMTVNDILNNICSVGRASWSIVDGKYTIVIDTYNTEVIQYFTPRNTKDFSGTKTFNELPTVLRIQFIDKDNDYIESSRNVFADGRVDDDEILDTDIVQETSMFGAMSASQVWKLGRYMHAVSRLRPEIYTFSTDIESLMCTRGDRIKLAHDVPLFGLSYGRVLNIIESGGNIDGIVIDEFALFEVGKDYGVTIRLQDGSSITKNVVNPGIDSQTLIFETPVTVEEINPDDLIMFGERGLETVDLLVIKIEPDADMGAVLTCVNYDEGIYTADSGVIPTYDPKISIGESGAINVGTIPQTNQDRVNESATIVQITDQIDYRMTANLPNSVPVTTSIGFYPAEFDLYNIVYVNYDDGNYMYKKTKAGAENGVAINSVSTGRIKKYENEIFYVNNDDEGKLYKKNANDTSNGSAITTVPIYDFDIDDTTGHIYYIDVNDHFLYRIEYGATGNGVLYYDSYMLDISYEEGTYFYYIDGLNHIQMVEDIGTKTEEIFYDGGPVHELDYVGGYVYYLHSEDLVIYKKIAPLASTSDDKGIPTYGIATGFTAISNGDVVFSSPTYGSTLFYSPSTTTLKNSSIDAVETVYSFTANIVEGSTALTGLSVEVVDTAVKRDKLIASGLDENTTILFVGNDFIYFTPPAIGTIPNADIIISGTRINLNANKVIVPGTIDAELLAATAINSKARADDQNFISEIDLDSGAYKFRKQDGTVVLDFDANRTVPTDPALVLNGDLDITSDDASRHIQVGSKGVFVEDSDGNPIHDLPDVPVTTIGDYCGHLLHLNSDASNVLVANFVGTNNWVTYTINNYGNSNVKAALLNVYMQNNDTGSAYSYLRPYGSTWIAQSPSSTSNRAIFLYGSFVFSTTVVVPVDAFGRFEIWTNNPTILFIQQFGIFI